MSVQFYKLLHFAGIIMVFMAYGGLVIRSQLSADNRKVRILGSITSGIGLILMLVGGFGLQAKLQLGWPIWIFIKLALWLLLGLLILLINRRPHLAGLTWWLTLLLGFIATFVATYQIGKF